MDRLRRYLRWHVMIWRFGGETERVLFIVLCATAYLFLPGVLIWLFASAWTLWVPFEFGVTVILAIFNGGLLLDVWGIAVYTKDSWQELLRLGQFSKHEAVASEFLTYLQAQGDRCRLQGAARLASLGWLVFYGLFALSVAFGIFVLPVVGPPTPAVFIVIDAPAVLAFRRFARSKHPILYGEADSAGVRLSAPLFSKFP